MFFSQLSVCFDTLNLYLAFLFFSFSNIIVLMLPWQKKKQGGVFFYVDALIQV